MSYKVENKANRPLVCTLGSNATLRLKIGGEAVIEDEDVTEHLRHLSSINKIKLTLVEQKSNTSKLKKEE